MPQLIVGWLVYTHEADWEYRFFGNRSEAEDCAAAAAERHGVAQWDIYPMRRGKAETCEFPEYRA